jgi:hypothetical protein
VHAFLHARVLLLCQLLLQFSARFLSHNRSSFLFGLVPTINMMFASKLEDAYREALKAKEKLSRKQSQ